MVLGILPDATKDVVVNLGQIALWLQTLGVIALILVLSAVVKLIYTFKSRKREKSIIERLEKIEKKIDKISKKK